MIRHYDGVLGTFDYDDEMFEVREDPDGIMYYGTPMYLQYIGDGKIELPDGCINTNRMFSGYKMPTGFTLGDKFDTGRVEDMNSMFFNCEMSKGFSLGKKFDTSSIRSTLNMFSECRLPKGFTPDAMSLF